jgi:ElaB/YqjD/DUF883 family membrane-anchored ribosome-binding protein
LEDAMNDASGGAAAGSTAETTQEKIQEAAGQAQESVRQQIDERSTQAGERVGGTADDLRSVGEELRKQGKDGPARLADKAAEQTEKVGSYLREKSSDDLLHDAEDFGRQRPWAVLTAGLALGVVAARFLKASSRDRYRQRSQPRSSRPSTLGAPPAPAIPPAPSTATAPAGDPVAPAVGT